MTARVTSKRNNSPPPPPPPTTTTTANLKLSPFLRPIKVQPAGSEDASSDVDAAQMRTRRGADEVPEPSVWALIPPAACSPLAQVSRVAELVLPRALWNFTSRYLPPETSWEARCEALVAFLGGEGAGGTGTGGFGIVVFAVLTNHVRRTFWPGSVVGGFGGPIGMLKLAAGSPEVFLREEVATGMRWWWWWKVVGDLGGLVAGGEVVRRVRTGTGTGMEGRRRRKKTTVAVVVVLVWALGAAEYVHARTAHVVALGIAYWRLGGGGEGGREVLWRVLVSGEGDFWSEGEGDHDVMRRGFWGNREAVLGGLVLHAEVVAYCVYGLGPLVWMAVREAVGVGRRRGRERGEWRCRWRPRPGLAVVMGSWAWGTGYVARYSNKYFIGLQMYEMVLVAWWVGVAGVVFGGRWGRGVVGRLRR